MILSDAKKTAVKIIGTNMCISYRNVWGFFSSSDCETQAVFITKDNGSAELSGIFLDKGEKGSFTEYGTGRNVPASAVFGKTFFDEDPSLFAECIPEHIPAVDRIESLFQENEEMLTSHGVPAGALVMLYDIVNGNDDEDAILLRLTVLRNYLFKIDKHISTEEFAYMCQELSTI